MGVLISGEDQTAGRVKKNTVIDLLLKSSSEVKGSEDHSETSTSMWTGDSSTGDEDQTVKEAC